MKGRFEAEKRNSRTALTRVAALSFLFLLACGNAKGQDLPPVVTVMLEQLAENGVTATDEVAERLGTLMENPIDINRATEEELRETVFLSTFQIASLLEYREKNGSILSLGELALVDGFNAVTVETIAPFIRVGEVLPQAEKKKRVQTEIRGRYAYPDYAYLRYKGSWGSQLRWGLTAEQDAGERAFIPDFLSGHFAVSDIPLSPKGNTAVTLRTAVVGDFSVRMGQGLTMWNGFSISGTWEPSSVIRYPDVISPYSSTDELNFCRGGAARVAFGKRFDVTAFYSNNAVDARCDSAYYYTLPDDGKHITDASVAARHGMREQVTGGSAVWKTSGFKIGINAVAYSYNRLDGRKKYPYNERQKYDGWWGNFSADFMFPVKLGPVHSRFFGEVASDAGFHIAALAGGTFAVKSSFEFSGMGRWYAPDYIAPHSGAYTVSSGCYNEAGFLLKWKWNALRRLSLTGMADFAYHPVERYRIEAGSRSLKLKMGGEWKIDRSNEISFIGGVYWKSYEENMKYSCRVTYIFRAENGFSLASRAEISVLGDMGGLLYAEGGYAATSGIWNIYARGTLFHVDDWDNRIYCYERDLYGTFSVPAAYGRGAECYLFGTVKPLDWLKLSLKCSRTWYASEEQENKFTVKFMFNIRF